MSWTRRNCWAQRQRSPKLCEIRVCQRCCVRWRHVLTRCWMTARKIYCPWLSKSPQACNRTPDCNWKSDHEGWCETENLFCPTTFTRCFRPKSVSLPLCCGLSFVVFYAIEYAYIIPLFLNVLRMSPVIYVSCFRSTTLSLAMAITPTRWHFAAHMGQLLRYTGDSMTGPTGCSQLWPKCPFSSQKLMRLSSKVSLKWSV